MCRTGSDRRRRVGRTDRVDRVWYRRRVRSLITLISTLVATVLVLAGCGQLSHDEYQAKLRDVGGLVERALEQVPTTERRELTSAEVDRLAERLRDAADELAGVTAPEDVQATQARFVRGLRGVATALTDLARDLERTEDESERAERLVEFASDDAIERSFDDLAGAQEAYQRAGYRLFTGGGAPSRPREGARAASSS